MVSADAKWPLVSNYIFTSLESSQNETFDQVNRGRIVDHNDTRIKARTNSLVHFSFSHYPHVNDVNMSSADQTVLVSIEFMQK